MPLGVLFWYHIAKRVLFSTVFFFLSEFSAVRKEFRRDVWIQCSFMSLRLYMLKPILKMWYLLLSIVLQSLNQLGDLVTSLAFHQKCPSSYGHIFYMQWCQRSNSKRLRISKNFTVFFLKNKTVTTMTSQINGLMIDSTSQQSKLSALEARVHAIEHSLNLTEQVCTAG